MNEVAPYMEFDGRFMELGDRFGSFHRLSGWNERYSNIQVESLLLRAVLRHAGGEDVGELHVRWSDEPMRVWEAAEHEPTLIRAPDYGMGCESMFDPAVIVDPRYLDFAERMWAGQPVPEHWDD